MVTYPQYFKGYPTQQRYPSAQDRAAAFMDRAIMSILGYLDTSEQRGVEQQRWQAGYDLQKQQLAERTKARQQKIGAESLQQAQAGTLQDALLAIYGKDIPPELTKPSLQPPAPVISQAAPQMISPRYQPPPGVDAVAGPLMPEEAMGPPISEEQAGPPTLGPSILEQAYRGGVEQRQRQATSSGMATLGTVESKAGGGMRKELDLEAEIGNVRQQARALAEQNPGAADYFMSQAVEIEKRLRDVMKRIDEFQEAERKSKEAQAYQRRPPGRPPPRRVLSDDQIRAIAVSSTTLEEFNSRIQGYANVAPVQTPEQLEGMKSYVGTTKLGPSAAGTEQKTVATRTAVRKQLTLLAEKKDEAGYLAYYNQNLDVLGTSEGQPAPPITIQEARAHISGAEQQRKRAAGVKLEEQAKLEAIKQLAIRYARARGKSAEEIWSRIVTLSQTDEGRAEARRLLTDAEIESEVKARLRKLLDERESPPFFTPGGTKPIRAARRGRGRMRPTD